MARLSWYISRLICKFRGHDYEMDYSYANPDTGAEEATCTRCGAT